MARGKYTTEDAERRLALALSVLAHILLVIFILHQPSPQPDLEAAINVTIEPPSKAITRQNQIVAPSEQRTAKPPENTSRLSEVDSAVEHEQIRRGDGGGKQQPEPERPEPAQPPVKSAPPRPPPPDPQQTKQQPEKQQPQKQPRKSDPADDQSTEAAPPSRAGETHQKRVPLKNLKLDDATLASRFGGSETAASKPQRPAATDLAQYQAFARPPGSGATFLGSGGVADHLPNLPDGDITLLNEKASTYAGFVRRVAVQVFAQLRSQGWERLSYSDVRRMSGFTTVEAVLSPQGSLIRVGLVSGSGSTQFDSVLVQSVNSGARDPNPPEGAKAADGLIHFIFKARSWADVAADARSGMPGEG